MAQRPFYMPNFKNTGEFILEDKVEFNFFTGFALSQKQKSIISFHDSIKKYIGFDTKILEISSKSLDILGVNLSAFNLKIRLKNGIVSTVESVFQGSKVFENGGPFTALYNDSSRNAKKFEELRNSGELRHFFLFGEIWSLEPKTAFYDWLYLNALNQNQDLAAELTKYDVFTDIEFNPNRSISCQAKSAALYVSLIKLNLLHEALKSKDDFLSILKKREYKNTLF
ncbi:DarT1-associated NADAR antitoxin family protein [Campylobacter concisus]|jgi:hypothetical protein|uniref:DarT1-associated NADAR antitoxin family protein n=1 Tax=Campylobacter concisus TaxID=199 RepID=UPI00122C33FD|nr:hypothetical protein [Campylobacter concisus]